MRVQPAPRRVGGSDTSAVGAANTALAAAEASGYRLAGNNCLDHAYRILRAYGAPDNRAVLNHWGCYNTDSQQWKFEFKGRYLNGYPVYQLRNKLSGKCVDAEDLGTANGTRLVQWTCNGGTNQEWY